MRRFLFTSAILVTVVLAVAATLPWWLGAALPLIGRGFGLRFDGYGRDGYARFRLVSLEVQRPGVKVTVRDVSAETPLWWLWHRWTGRPSAVTAAGWLVEVERRDEPVRRDGPRGWLPLKQKLARVGDRLDLWLPRANVGAGQVRWPGHEIDFGPAIWRERTLTVERMAYRRWTAVPVVTIGADGELQGSVRDAESAATAELSTQGSRVLGRVSWHGQPATAEAEFDPAGWAPREAIARAKAWKLPGEAVAVGAQYEEVAGDATVTWKDRRLRVDVAAAGRPRDAANVPPLSAAVRGEMDTEGFRAETLTLTGPGLRAQLTSPVAIDWKGHLRSSGSQFAFDIALAKLPWPGWRGTVRGEAAVTPDAAGAAVVAWTATAEDVAAGKFASQRAETEGRLAWPVLAVEQLSVTLPDGRSFAASGSWNFRTRELADGRAQGAFTRALVAPWLPENVGFSEVEVEATARGRWGDIASDGRGRVAAATMHGLKPFDGEVSWRLRGTTIEAVTVVARAGATTLQAKGAGDFAHLDLSELTLTRDGREGFALGGPATVRWRGGFQLEGLRWRGPDARLDAALRWADAGRIELEAQNVAGEWLQDIFPATKLNWTAEKLSLRGTWDGGPANLELAARASVKLGPDRTATVDTRVRSEGDALVIEALHVAEGTGVIVNATGRLPLSLHPRASPLVRLRDDAPFALTAESSTNPAFWRELAHLTGFAVIDPEVAVKLEGTLARPRGNVVLRAARLATEPGEFDWGWPSIENLDLRLIGDEHGVKLERGSLALEGQAVTAEGWLPLGEGGWREMSADPLRVLQRGRVRVRIPDADLAAAAHFFPAYLAPKGHLQADLTFRGTEGIDGSVRVAGATSRPLGPLGVLQDVTIDLNFAGRTVELKKVAARMGGQEVALTGRAALGANERPEFDLKLAGTNLPFVRQTGLLLRGDLDLNLKSESRGRAAITGAVRLRDSLFLSDIRALIPTGQKGAPARPPYFSIEAAPVNRWRIDVAVTGDKFMRLRTPVFSGVASAKFQIAGTLGEPRATGEASIDEGSIRLPFANFAVQQGQVRLTAEQPEPQLQVTGTTRRYGYDLRLELTGTATNPLLTFSSSPPLDSEQVLLMVMAGQAPRDEIATTERQRAARVGAFVGQSLLGAIGGDAGGADRLTISSGENVSAQGRETYSIEYRLNDRWSLTGEYDEFDDYYGGVKWRFYQKGGKQDEDEK